MATEPKTFLTPEQYLEIERKAEYKSEYYRGEMFAMSGASRAHNTIARNIGGLLYNQLRGGPCEWYQSDMRVRVSATGLYTYPDFVITCDPQFLDREVDTLANPTAIIEVLSPSTEGYDRGHKFDQYRTIPSFKQYMLISSDRFHADLFTRQDNGEWSLTPADGLDASIEFAGCRLKLADIYEKVEITATR